MKLKQATQLAIIGVFFLLIPGIVWTLSSFGVLSTFNTATGKVFLFTKLLGILGIIGYILLLPFFMSLYKSQK